MIEYLNNEVNYNDVKKRSYLKLARFSIKHLQHACMDTLITAARRENEKYLVELAILFYKFLPVNYISG